MLEPILDHCRGALVGLAVGDALGAAVEWWRTGKYSVNGRCFDIGTTTTRALNKFLATKDASQSGDPSESASGNGSIMRLAPVAIHYCRLFPDKIEALGRIAEESSLPTHASAQCLSACRYMALVLCGLIHGEDRGKVLSPDWEPLAALKAAKPLHPQQEMACGECGGCRNPTSTIDIHHG